MKMKFKRIKQIFKGIIESGKYIKLYEDHNDLLREYNNLLNEINELKRPYERMDLRCAILEPRVKYLAKINKQLVDLLNMDNKKLYYLLEKYDADHQCLHNAVKDFISLDVCSYFYAEDNLGYFEGDDYVPEIKYLEAYQFAEITYEISGCYEIVNSINLDY
jgi:hypothetical protein